MDTPRVLIVEDDVHFRPVLFRVLGPHYIVIETRTAELALEFLIHGHTFDVVLCDMGLDGWSGGDLYRRLKRRGDPHASRFVILSGLDVWATDPNLAAELGERLLEKPIDPRALLECLAVVRAQAAA